MEPMTYSEYMRSYRAAWWDKNRLSKGVWYTYEDGDMIIINTSRFGWVGIKGFQVVEKPIHVYGPNGFRESTPSEIKMATRMVNKKGAQAFA